MKEDKITQETDEFNVIFLHSSLDDAGLAASEFRVLAHLCRRAGKKGKAFPGIDSMSKKCRLSRETVIECVRSLELYGMITANRTQGASTVYRLTGPESWRLDLIPVPVPRGAAAKKDPQSNQGNGSETSRLGGTLPVGSRERTQSDQGNVRISTEGNPIKDNAASPRARVKKAPAPLFQLPQLPDSINTPGVMAAMDLWLDVRKKKRAPITEPIFTRVVADLVAWGAQDAEQALINSARSNWTDVYAPKVAPGRQSFTRAPIATVPLRANEVPGIMDVAAELAAEAAQAARDAMQP